MQVNLTNLIAAQSARPAQAQAKPQVAPFSSEVAAQAPAFEPLPLAKTASPRGVAVQTPAAGMSRPGAQLNILV